ncbi:hypothetical protein HMPREF9374_3191 [Desmospora sp. 8437]|nr:hypothetical protein HMPREF9374_3191 [Desmospora sp. 8437]
MQDLGAAVGPVFAYAMIGLPIGMTGFYLVGALALLCLAFLPGPRLQTNSCTRPPDSR